MDLNPYRSPEVECSPRPAWNWRYPTLVECLIILTIIGIVVTLLLPDVQ
jgi:hypothetical protein